MPTIREAVAHLAIEAARSKPLKDKKIKHETDKTVQAPDDLAREKGKAPDAKTGRIVTSRLKAGGPGSGRKPGGGSSRFMTPDDVPLMGKFNKANKLAEHHAFKSEDYGDKADANYARRSVGSHFKDLANTHSKISDHFSNAANAYDSNKEKEGDMHFAKGVALKQSLKK